MSLYVPKKYQKPVLDLNKFYLEKLRGELDNKQAASTLIPFLMSNLDFTVELLAGIKLASYQLLALKAMFKRNFILNVWGRGAAKSFMAAVFCATYPLFYPESKIIIAGPTFRTARNIFTEMKKIIDNPRAAMLKDCFAEPPSMRTDLFQWNINGGSIKAIPLNGEKIRGFRANVLIIDEALLLSKEIIENVLKPFLSVNANIEERLRTQEKEDLLISQGRMTEEERTQFPDDQKIIYLSSASYTFEYLYTIFKDWRNEIYSEIPLKKNNQATYFISQLSHSALPPGMMSSTIIEEAKNGGSSHSSFLREYGAQFTDGSDGYFSAKKMKECTVQDGDCPHLLLEGDKSKKYILSVDSNFSNSESADFFAMCLVELDEENRDATVVHNYSNAGDDLKHHINYFFYLITYFPVHLIVLDSAGGRRFIEAANLSEEFRNAHKQYDFIDFDGDKIGGEYEQMLNTARNQLNFQDGRICIDQRFTSEWIRDANEILQGSIDKKKVWFGSKIRACGSFLDSCASTKMDAKKLGYEDILELIDEQDILIDEVKKQCALIEVRSTTKGTQSFDLPQHLKRSTGKNRARKDNYTALMLANYGVKAWFNLKDAKVEEIQSTFVPMMFG